MTRKHVGCPKGRLEDLLAGRLSGLDEAELDRHLDACVDCREVLEALAAGRSWWSGLRDLALGSTPALRSPDGPVVGISPGFLDPPEGPGSLGRLGPYTVERVLGRGGMGVVLKAFDPALNRIVAIKVIAPELATSAAARRRFAREARAAAAVSHDHVVAIHAVAESPGGLPYLVMPYIPGQSLQERIDARGPLDVEAILRVGMQAAAGLAAAHSQGLVHRDIKPANILMEEGVERVKITDFGLARAADDASLSQSGVVAGTPQYMAPEQARGEAVDPRSDLFSLGSVLYAMAAGHPPFRAETAMGVLRRVSDDQARPIREINPDVPEWLAAIIERLHAKDPAGRFQSAGEVAELLARCLVYLRQPVRSEPPYRARAPRQEPRRRFGWAAAAMIALAATGLGAVEAAGLTHFASFLGKILKFQTPEGTLVVEVDDPEVKVALDDKDLVITGPGPQEVRLRLGQHRLTASKDGKPVRDELITITRDNKPTVTVRREPDPAPDRPAVAEAPGTVLTVPRFYAPGPPNQANPASSTIVAGPEIPGLDQAGALQPVPLDDPSPVPLWPGSSVTYLAYSPDGKSLALASNFDREILIFDTATRQRRATLKGHMARAWALAFSPDGKEVAAATGDWGFSANSGKVWTWDLAKPDDLGVAVATDIPLVFAVAYSPDGKTLAFAGWDDEVKLFDRDTRTIRATCQGHEDAAKFLAYSPDGKTLASASWDNTVRLWDPATGKPKGDPLKAFRAGVSCLAFSPDGKLLAATAQDPKKPEGDQLKLDKVVVWDVATRTEKARLGGHPGTTYFVAFSPDGKTMATSGGLKDQFGEVKVWDVASWTERTTLGGFRSWVGCLAFSPDGKTLIACADHGGQRGEVRAWDLTPILPRTGEFRPDGSPAWSLAYSPDGRMLAVGIGLPSRHGRVWLREIASGRADWAYGTHLGVRTVAFSRDGSRLASGSFDGTATVSDRAGRVQFAIRASDRTINALALSPDGKTLATAARDGAVQLYETENGDKIRVLEGDEAWSLAFSPDGSTLAAGMKDGSIASWTVETWEKRQAPAGHSLGVAGLAFSPDGKTLASASWDRTIKLWDPAVLIPVATLEGHPHEVRSVAFSPDGQTLASGDGPEAGTDLAGTLMTWDLATRAPRVRLRAHPGRIGSVAFSPDGKTLATAADDGLVRFWDASAIPPEVLRRP